MCQEQFGEIRTKKVKKKKPEATQETELTEHKIKAPIKAPARKGHMYLKMTEIFRIPLD